jgi:PhzF family phenazine biosynthesis protein
VQQGVAGLLPLRVDVTGRARSIAVRTPPSRVMEVAEAHDQRLAPILRGWELGALPPVLMDGGRRWWLVELSDESTLRAIQPQWEAIRHLAERSDSMGVCVFARCTGQPYELVVRAFVGTPAQFEDAASGAANATLAAWLASRNALPGSNGRYRVSQGREVGHDARLQMHVDETGDVWSGGHVCSVVTGVIDWR